MKTKMTADQRAALLWQIKVATVELTNGLAEDLRAYLEQQARKLTDSELQELNKYVINASGLIYQYQAESTKRDTRRVVRWLKNRP